MPRPPLECQSGNPCPDRPVERRTLASFARSRRWGGFEPATVAMLAVSVPLNAHQDHLAATGHLGVVSLDLGRGRGGQADPGRYCKRDNPTACIVSSHNRSLHCRRYAGRAIRSSLVGATSGCCANRCQMAPCSSNRVQLPGCQGFQCFPSIIAAEFGGKNR